MDEVHVDELEFTPKFWVLFFDTMREMGEQGLLPEHPDEASASLFFTYLSAKMIERSEDPMPPLDQTILIVNQLLARELPKVIAAMDRVIDETEPTNNLGETE